VLSTDAVDAPLIAVSNLEKTYVARRGTKVRALGGISLDIAPGEFVTIVGQSGCGKTTLLKILAGLLVRSAT
jgi:NitT/TauT family transport system ATP-binding protein